MKCKRVMASLAACVTAFSGLASQTVLAANTEHITVELDSGAERSSQVISANDSITVDGKELRVIATGLKDDNKAAFLKAVEDNFSFKDDKPVKIVDEAFVDAEKASVTSFLYESALCWAASASDLLWLTGWAENYKAPGSDTNFDSEDAVFDYYSERFINKGSYIGQAIDWFFMGVYVNEGTGAIAFPVYSDDPAYGLDKDFVSTLAMEKYSLTDDYTAIEQLERTDRSCDSPVVFQGSIGTTYENDLSESEHSITIGGVIIDPDAKTPDERYKGIIIIDSDNDGDSDEFEIDGEYPDEVRKASRESRPNSYTVYDLDLIELKSGKKCWEIVNYNKNEDNSPYIIYDMTAFPLYDEEIAEKYTETEGTKKHYENPDLYIYDAFTTSEDEVLEAPFEFVMADRTKSVFAQGEHINVNFFIGNKGTVSLDGTYAEGNTFNVDWSVKNTETGETAAYGRQPITSDIYAGVTAGRLINLNVEGNDFVSWEPGEYELTLTVNPDRMITECYYLNNTDFVTSFTVVEGADTEEITDPDSDPTEDKGSDSGEGADNSDNSEASGKTDSGNDTATTTSNPRTAAKAGAALMLLAAAGAVFARGRKR